MKKRRIAVFVCTLLLVGCMCALGVVMAGAEAAADITVTIDTSTSVTLKDADGDGYYDIGTADELYAFAAAVGGGNTAINGELTKDIVVNTDVLRDDGFLNGDGSNFRVWTPIGNDTNTYTGIFDGNSHTISGLYINDTAKDYVGLFGYVKGGIVRNVTVSASCISGQNYVGGMVGYNYAGRIENCVNEGLVVGAVYYVGGVVGYNEDGTVTDCSNTSSAYFGANEYIGGVVGKNCATEYDMGKVENCYNACTINANMFAGGVVGYNYSTYVRPNP